MEEIKINNEWDKVFPINENVEHKKITFHNRYGITLVADEYVPKEYNGKLPAIAVSGPFGASKEQSSGLYAQEMASRGFLAIAFDPSFTGESGGEPRNMASPDINTEDFMAAADYLSCNELVDSSKISIIGICGFGGMALNAAALDTRVKATVAMTMYDMTRVNANGYFDSQDAEGRFKTKEVLNAQRTKEYKEGKYYQGGGVVDPLPLDAPFFVKDYHDYYKTKRGYHARSLNSNNGWNITGCMSFINQPILKYSSEIRSAVLIMHGEKAHSLYFGRDAYINMTGHKIKLDTVYPTKNGFHIPSGLKIPKIFKTNNKELFIVPNANHTDLYDGGDKKYINFDYIEDFIKRYI